VCHGCGMIGPPAVKNKYQANKIARIAAVLQWNTRVDEDGPPDEPPWDPPDD